MRITTLLLIATALPLGGSGCAGMAPRIYSPLKGVSGAAERGDHALEIEALAMELADRAESRSPLGNARIRVETLDAIEPRRSPYRQVSVLERDLRATEATVRHELGMSLANRVNIVGDSAELATHRIEGEFLRSASALELSLRLVEIKSDWIVATARRRIENFVPEHYDRRLQSKDSSLPSAVEAPSASRQGKQLDSSIAQAPSPGRTRALRPAYPRPTIEAQSEKQPEGQVGKQAGGQVAAQPAAEVVVADVVPEPTTVLSAGARSTDPALGEGGPPAEGPIRFDSGPAAARLRANGTLPELSEVEPAQRAGAEH